MKKQQKHIRISGKRREVDVGKFALAVVLLAERLAEEKKAEAETADSQSKQSNDERAA